MESNNFHNLILEANVSDILRRKATWKQLWFLLETNSVIEDAIIFCVAGVVNGRIC